MKNFLLSLLVLLFTQICCSQNLLLLNGKVTVSELSDLKEISILNKTQKYEKVTSPGGYFSIKVALNDTLVFKSDYLYDYEHIVTQHDFTTDLLQVKMVKMSNILQEVTIFKSLNPVDFGILSKPAKQYTVTERRLKTASTGPVDLLVNSINGKRKMYKKLIQLENQSGIENKFIALYGRYNLQTDFDIPAEYIESFSQYACHYSNITNAVKDNNKKILMFLLIDISKGFKKEHHLVTKKS